MIIFMNVEGVNIILAKIVSTVPEVKNFKTPGKPYLLNYCIECDEI